MSYKYYFFDDQEVGAEDLNKLVKMFAASGVADNFENGVPYNISKLNEVITANSSEGTVPETCDTLKVSADAGFAFIEPGVAFFKDGTVIEIESREQLELPENAACYVYLKSDAQQNKAYPTLSEALLEDENIVPLAHISETGEVSDLRQFARGKVPSFYASSAGIRVEQSFSFSRGSEYLKGEKRLTLIEGANSYRYLLIICKRPHSSYEIGHSWSSLALYDTETNMCYYFNRDAAGKYIDDHSNITVGTAFTLLKCEVGLSKYTISAQLYFTDDKVELLMTGDVHNGAQSSFEAHICPLEMNVVAF